MEKKLLKLNSPVTLCIIKNETKIGANGDIMIYFYYRDVLVRSRFSRVRNYTNTNNMVGIYIYIYYAMTIILKFTEGRKTALSSLVPKL